jgi:hypothetical protein
VTLCEDSFLMDTKRRTLATLALRLLSSLAGENFEVLGSLKVRVPAIFFLFPPTLVPLPCLRKIVGLSLTSGLKLTRLLALRDI